jgi:molecular chaperone GrpE (heat shock protein)
MDRLTQARAVFERRSAAYERMKDHLPSHQRAELLADLMEACDELDGALEASQSQPCGDVKNAATEAQPSAARAA